VVGSAIFDHGGEVVVGGGLYVDESDGVILNNTIIRNRAGYGAGVYLRKDSSELRGNTIRHNRRAVLGAGLYLFESQAVLAGNSIVDNSAEGGGGIYINDGDVMLVSNVISANVSHTGGGLYVAYNSAGLRHNLVYGNVAQARGSEASWGGGLYVYESDLAFSDNTVLANTADYGGGLSLIRSAPVFTNVVLARNEGHISGGGLYLRDGSARLLHTTLARNGLAEPNADGGGIAVINGEVVLTNTILVSHVTGIYLDASAVAMLEGTLWGKGAWGNGDDWAGPGVIEHRGDIYGDPSFVDADGDDFHIEWESAAVDRGIEAGVLDDIDDHPRPIGTGYDLGADEQTGLDLSTSSLVPSQRYVNAGQVLTYAITLRNTGPLSASDSLLVSAVPTSTTYISGSAQTASGTLSDGHSIRWVGAIVPGEAVTVTYRVTVNESVLIESTAWLTDRYGVTTTLRTWINGWSLYTPLILRASPS
jgi:uncharacterized repeat protein (TIGR01451 family)